MQNYKIFTTKQSKEDEIFSQVIHRLSFLFIYNIRIHVLCIYTIVTASECCQLANRFLFIRFFAHFCSVLVAHCRHFKFQH